MSYLSVLARHVLRDHESSSGVYEVINKLVNILPWYLFELWRESDILPVGSQEDENPGEQFVELVEFCSAPHLYGVFLSYSLFKQMVRA